MKKHVEMSKSRAAVRPVRRGRGVLLAVFCLCACGRKGDGGVPPANKTEAAAIQTSGDTQFRYPIGTWWRDAATTSRFAFSAAHILISHRDAEPDVPLAWIAARPVSRTREQAIKLALEIRSELRTKPDHFAELARAHSDDGGSSARRGRLGVLRTPRVPMEVVDAIGHLAVGEISEVVETSAGYHVLQRLQVPPELTVAAREITIRHTGVRSGSPRLGRPTRGRNEAEALASTVADAARKEPARFAELVDEYSDDLLAVDGGDCGTFSNFDVFAEGVVADALSEVPIGGVTGPIETLQGIKVLQRTAPTDRLWLVASQIVVSHEGTSRKPGVGAPDRSREEARKLAERLLSRLEEAPSMFDALRTQYSPERAVPRLWWQAGRGIPGVSRVVAEVPAGALVRRIVETPLGFHIFRRDDLNAHPVDPSDPRLSSPLFELPRPPLPGLVAFLKDTPDERLSVLVRQFRSDAIQEVGLAGEASAAFSAVYERLIGDMPKLSVEGKALRMEEVGGQITPLLSTAQMERFVLFRSRWIKERMSRR